MSDPFDNSVAAGFPASVLYSSPSESKMPNERDSEQKTLHKIAEILLSMGAAGGVVATTVEKVRYDLPIAVSASIQEVTVLAGAYAIEAFITNVTDENPYALSLTDSEADFETVPPRVSVNREFNSAGNIILTEPETKIRFPIGAVGVVSVMGPVGFAKPVVAEI